MKICWVSGFYRRHKCTTRIIRMYLLQDYPGDSILLLYNNGPEIYSLSDIELPPNKQILLINNNKELSTGDPYKDTGTIFQDSLTFIPDDVEVVSFGDVDDFYSLSHLSRGVEGYKEALKLEKLAYKPYYSWFKYVGQEVKLQYNTMEPSWFINKEFLLKHGMYPVTSSYHRKWIDALEKEGKAFIDPKGESTFLYWWGGDDGVYKTSSKGDSLESFKQLREYEKNRGEEFLSPAPEKDIQRYYDIVGWKTN